MNWSIEVLAAERASFISMAMSTTGASSSPTTKREWLTLRIPSNPE
ncbi:MAG: hypothetical protein M0T82_01820 [Desulfobacteraceae bacterium]|nr:hypothetical protein [Desulfobacteraceae bacterium]